MSDKLAHMLRDSSFASVAECERFLNWYEQADFVTEYDKNRCDIATAILIQADAEGDPDY